MMAFTRISLAFLLLVAALLPAGAEERILRFVSDVHVQRNGDLLVTETIRVRAEGREIRRGILRDFPTTYTARDGTRVVVGFDVTGVTRNGAPETFTTESIGNGVRVRIGRGDVLLNHGVYEYAIRYRTTRQIGFFPDFDELYWNATGNGWTLAIDEAVARITLPENVAFLQSAFYTGPQGARGKAAAIVTQAPGLIVFRTTAPLPPRNGLTVAAAWPKGVVTAPTDLQKAGWWFWDNGPVVIAALGLLLVLGYYFHAWRQVGRDPRRGTVIPLFGPPDGMSAAAVRYVSQMGYDQRTFTAAMIELGVRGRLKMKESHGALTLESRAGGKDIPAPEQAMARALFQKKSSLKLVQSNHQSLRAAEDGLRGGLANAYAGKMFQNNTGWSVRGLLASLAAVAVIILAVFAIWGSEQGTAMLIGPIFLIPAVVVVIGLLNSGWPASIKGWLVRLTACAFAVPFTIGAVAVMLQASRSWVELLPASVPLVLLPVAASAFSWMKAHTVAGRVVTDQIEGLRQYLAVAEEDRLNYLHPPEKTPELFERLLPYAVALEVENAWAQKFAGVLASAAAAAAIGEWYSGDRDWTRDPVRFADSIGDGLLEDHFVRVDASRIERRQFKQRFVRRRVLRWRRRWRRRLRLVGQSQSPSRTPSLRRQVERIGQIARRRMTVLGKRGVARLQALQHRQVEPFGHKSHD